MWGSQPRSPELQGQRPEKSHAKVRCNQWDHFWPCALVFTLIKLALQLRRHLGLRCIYRCKSWISKVKKFFSSPLFFPLFFSFPSFFLLFFPFPSEQQEPGCQDKLKEDWPREQPERSGLVLRCSLDTSRSTLTVSGLSWEFLEKPRDHMAQCFLLQCVSPQAHTHQLPYTATFSRMKSWTLPSTRHQCKSSKAHKFVSKFTIVSFIRSSSCAPHFC